MDASSFLRCRAAAMLAPTALAVSALAVAVLPCSGTTLRVPSQYPTIQAGIDAAAHGDTVLVEPGTYEESVNIRNKALALLSTEGRTATTVRGERYYAIAIDGDPLPSVSGFTFTLPGASGGGVGEVQPPGPRFESCAFVGSMTGASIGNGFDTGALFDDCHFTDNVGDGLHVSRGGVVYVNGGEIAGNGGHGLSFEAVHCHISLQDCQIRGNDGDGVHSYFAEDLPLGSVQLTGCVVEDNGGRGFNGAGIATLSPNFASFEAVECTIAGNAAGGLTGHCFPLTLGSCVIADNRGYAVEANGAGATLEACLVYGNDDGILGFEEEDPWGGWLEADIHISRSTIHRNGTGVRVLGPHRSDLEIQTSIVSGSLNGPGVPFCDQEIARYTVACTDLFANAGGDDICPAVDLGGNFSADPLFCDPGIGDFTLQDNSPCAPEHSPAGCGLIGALPVGCGATGIAGGEARAPKVLLTVIPNPVHSGATFTFDDGIESSALEIYDPNGRLINLLRPTDHSATWLPGSDARSGVYFARLRGAGGTRVVKFLVVR